MIRDPQIVPLAFALSFFIILLGALLRSRRPSLWRWYRRPANAVVETVVARMMERPPSGAYDAAKAFRKDVIAADGLLAWLSDDVARRAVALAEAETGLAPTRGNAAGQALMRYAILSRKVARDAELTQEERRIVEKLTAGV